MDTNNATGAQSGRLSVARAGECLAWRQGLTGRLFVQCLFCLFRTLPKENENVCYDFFKNGNETFDLLNPWAGAASAWRHIAPALFFSVSDFCLTKRNPTAATVPRCGLSNPIFAGSHRLSTLVNGNG
jgi:hypothetical protein